MASAVTVTLPVFVTRNSYVTACPATLIVVGEADLTRLSAACCVTSTLTADGLESTWLPAGSVNVAVAVLLIEPLSMSAWVTVWLAGPTPLAGGRSGALRAGAARARGGGGGQQRARRAGDGQRRGGGGGQHVGDADGIQRHVAGVADHEPVVDGLPHAAHRRRVGGLHQARRRRLGHVDGGGVRPRRDRRAVRRGPAGGRDVADRAVVHIGLAGGVRGGTRQTRSRGERSRRAGRGHRRTGRTAERVRDGDRVDRDVAPVGDREPVGDRLPGPGDRSRRRRLCDR